MLLRPAHGRWRALGRTAFLDADSNSNGWRVKQLSKTVPVGGSTIQYFLIVGFNLKWKTERIERLLQRHAELRERGVTQIDPLRSCASSSYLIDCQQNLVPFRCVLLELVLQGELNDARIGRRRGDHAKCRPRNQIVSWAECLTLVLSARVVEVCGVRKVEELSTYVDEVGLGEPEGPFKSQVNVALAGTANETYAAVAEVCVAWPSCIRRLGCGSERGRIEICG